MNVITGFQFRVRGPLCLMRRTPIYRRHATFDPVVLNKCFKMNECGIALGIPHKAGKINRCRTQSQDLD